MSDKKVNDELTPMQRAARRNQVIGDRVFFGLLAAFIAMAGALVQAFFN